MHQGASIGPRFVPAPGSTAGFMFDNKTAQVCWAGEPEGNPTLPKAAPNPGSFDFANALPKPGIPTCKTLL
jgi:hypothetical protein